jgi:hypothetical protein
LTHSPPMKKRFRLRSGTRGSVIRLMAIDSYARIN